MTSSKPIPKSMRQAICDAQSLKAPGLFLAMIERADEAEGALQIVIDLGADHHLALAVIEPGETACVSLAGGVIFISWRLRAR